MLAVKFAIVGNRAIQSFGDFHRHFYRLRIWHRQSPRVPEANFADVDIGRRDEWIIGTTTKHLALGFELDMNLQADDGDEFRHSVFMCECTNGTNLRTRLILVDNAFYDYAAVSKAGNNCKL